MLIRPLVSTDVEWMRPLGLAIPNGGRRFLEPCYLPLDDELTVLYGLNGAGKSFVLDALSSCLSGTRQPRQENATVFLVGQLPPEDKWPNGLTNAFRAVVGDEDASGSWMQDLLAQVLTVSFSRYWTRGWWDDFEARFDLADEFARSGTFLVSPVGRGEPAWEIRPAVIPSASTPASAEFLRLLRANSEDDDYVTLAPVYELWDGSNFSRISHPDGAPTVLYSEAYRFEVRGKANVRLWDRVVTDEENEVDRETAQAISRALSPALDPFMEPSQESLESLSEAIQVSANMLYTGLLRDAPVLKLEIAPVGKWLTEAPLRWMVHREQVGDQIPVAWLSKAEQRWARVAIRLALSSSPMPLLLLDEPEGALHRTAEHHMAVGLAKLAGVESRVLVATHSPELLDARGGRRVLVRRRTHEQPGGLAAFTGADFESMDALGLQPSDLLRRTRGFMLVEGEHDVEVLHGYFGDRMAELGVETLPLRGGSKLKTALDTRFLFDYTDAILFPFLDDLDADEVTRAWQAASTTAKISSKELALEQLQASLRDIQGKGGEFLAPFLTRALQQGRESRVVPLGIRETDILDYLPVAAIVAGATSWKDLRAQQARDRGGSYASETEFKDWLRRRHSADLSPERIGAIARASVPPRELAGVWEVVARKVSEP